MKRHIGIVSEETGLWLRKAQNRMLLSGLRLYWMVCKPLKVSRIGSKSIFKAHEGRQNERFLSERQVQAEYVEFGVFLSAPKSKSPKRSQLDGFIRTLQGSVTMPHRLRSFRDGFSAFASVLCLFFFFSDFQIKADASVRLVQDAAELKQPWELRARPHASSGGLSTLSDASAESTSSIIRQVLRIRSTFMPLFSGIPYATPETPGLLIFSDTEEMLFTLRTRLAVSSASQAPARSFLNDSGQFIAVATDQTNSLAFDRALQSSALEQMLIPLFEDRLPPWARTGLLQYAGSLHWRDARLFSGESCAGLLQALQSPQGDDQLIPIERLLTLDAAQWADFERRGGVLRMQANAWLMVHFLIHGENGRLVPFFRDWLHAVAIGRDGALDLAARLAPVFSLEAFEKARSSHVRTLVPGQIESFREQAELLRVLMQELEDSSIRTLDSNALKVELDLLADREIELHAFPFTRMIVYSGIEAFKSCSFVLNARDDEEDNATDPSAGPAPMGLEFVHPTGESVRIEWISTPSGWKSVVAW